MQKFQKIIPKIYHSNFLLLALIISCSKALGQHKLKLDFDESVIPAQPNFAEQSSWAALPTMKDYADSLPANTPFHDGQMEAQVDVFFLYPTIYTFKPEAENLWNASIQDVELNEKIAKTTILNQATAFNGSCKVYAPRYRQAHYSVFTTEKPANKSQAMDIAYQDIKRSFEYYLENWNGGRPIVIASHSQGTIHAGRLLKEFFDGKPLQKKLVAAYLIGIATPTNYFENIPLSQSASEVGSWVSWNCFLKGYYPTYYDDGLNVAACVNPLSWTTDEEWRSYEMNQGAIGYKYRFVDQALGAQCKDGMLWIEKPRMKGRIFIRRKIWHFADINLFWNNIRENVALRISSYKKVYGL